MQQWHCSGDSGSVRRTRRDCHVTTGSIVLSDKSVLEDDQRMHMGEWAAVW